MNIDLSNVAQAIIANAMAAIDGARVDGKKVFGSVSLVEDAASFVRVSDPLAAREADVAIVDAQPEQRPGTIDVEDAIFRMTTDIVVHFIVSRDAGADEKATVMMARRYAEIVRAALMYDPSRDGRANLIVFSGQLINGTDVSGRPRLLPAVENSAFRSLIIPVAFGWAAFKVN